MEALDSDWQHVQNSGDIMPPQSVRLHAQLSQITAIAIVRVHMPVRKSNYWPKHVILWYDGWRCSHFNWW